MKKTYRSLIEEFVSKNFWGILFSVVSFLSVILIAILGIGVFILALIVGGLAFIIGNSKDNGIPPIENFKRIVDKINEKLKSIKK